MNEQVVNPSPKKRYLTNAVMVKQHREMFSSVTAQTAIDFAMLEYQHSLVNQRGDMGTAAANHYKMAGALEFVHLLKSLAEAAPLPVPPAAQNLKPV